jgi:hypothetical protein
MGSWGPGLYSDDLAADVRDDLRDLVGHGLNIDDAVDRLASEYASSLADPDEASVFWIVVADVAWTIGRPHERATEEALRAIDSGADLRRWDDAKYHRKREAVLDKLATKLKSAAPPPKRIPKPFVAANDWRIGEVVAFRLRSGKFTLLRVLGHNVDKGGKSAVCELLDWVGAEPQDVSVGDLSVRECRGSSAPQFMLAEPRKKKDIERFSRMGIESMPSQLLGRFSVFVFPYVDEQLADMFGVE